MIEISVDRTSGSPLYAQIREALQAAMASGTLSAGDRLPAVAALAREVGVTQATVRRALEDLVAAGHIEAHVGRGTFVRDPGARPSRAAATPTGGVAGRPSRAAATAAPGTADRRSGMAGRPANGARPRGEARRSLDALMALTRRPGLLRFTSGLPDAGIAGDGVLEQLASEAFRQGSGSCGSYGDPQGVPELRDELARRLGEAGASVHRDQILITSGSQQGVSLMAQTALVEDRRILCETPGYTGVPEACAALGLGVKGVARDREGPLPESLDRHRQGRSSLLYLCPELHNPMGTDLSPARRLALIDWARHSGGLLVADEIFRDLRFDGPAPRSLLHEAGPGRTVAIGSVSKSFLTGLRIGWLVSSAERIRGLTALKHATDLGCPPLMQGIATILLRGGRYDAHVEEARRVYRSRRDATLESLEATMPEGVRWTRPQGGFHMWLELPAGYSSIALLLLAIERGVAIIPGPCLDLDHGCTRGFALRYGALDEERIRDGVERLGAAVRALLSQPPEDRGPDRAEAYL